MTQRQSKDVREREEEGREKELQEDTQVEQQEPDKGKKHLDVMTIMNSKGSNQIPANLHDECRILYTTSTIVQQTFAWS